MKTNRMLLKLTVVYILMLSLSVSCKKDNREPDYSYFVSKELIYSYDKEYITSLIGTLSNSVPDVEKFTPLIQNDISIYKIVYKTRVNNEDINASGLICVPANRGDYPVISFQNGTNTMNANAPSESPQAYQLIGLVASMGYIVVVADYPGFGESANVPHPYLVKEPMVRSLVDLLYAVGELPGRELPDITVKNEYYLLGYSLGGWATLALAKELELNRSQDFDLKGSMCGAGPYNITLLLQNMVEKDTYSMPSYMGFILNAYKAYDQFTNPVTDIFNEPYASRVSSLYNGTMSLSQINAQLTNSIPELITAAFLTGFATSPQYESVRQAFINNSIPGWKTFKPFLFIHGENDTQVDPLTTENIYSEMLAAGTSANLIEKVIIPGADHGDGGIPAIVQGILFINNLRDQNQ